MRGISRITLTDTFKAARLALWDESAGRLVPFRDARRPRPAIAA